MYVSEVQRTVELDYDPYGNRISLLLEAVDLKLEDGSLVRFTYKKRRNQFETTKL